MKTLTIDKRALVLLLLSLVYLLLEVVFNARLVDAAGSLEADSDHIYLVEVFGRAASGIGGSLLLAALLQYIFTRLSTIILVLVSMVIAWPSIYFGQRWALEHYLVEQSSPVQRQQAFFSQLLKTGFSQGIVEIEGLPVLHGATMGHADKTFLTLFSGLLYADPTLDDVLRPQYTEMARNYAKGQMQDNFDEHYARYRKLRSEIDVLYGSYVKSSKRYFDTINNYDKQADKSWKQVDQQLDSAWKRYQGYRKKVLDKASKFARRASKDIPSYFERRQRCRTRSCITKLDQSYDKSIQGMGLGPIAAQTWLVEDSRSWLDKNRRCHKRNCHTKITLGSLIDLFSDEKTFTYTRDVEHYRRIILDKMGPDFEKKTGYPVHIESRSTFSAQAKTAKKIRNALSKQGIKLPENWQLHQRNDFYQAVRQRILKQAQRTWSNSRWERELDIKPGLSRALFERSDAMQQQLRKGMGTLSPTGLIRTHWNDRQFHDNAIVPAIEQETRRLIDIIDASVHDFADGESLALRGKDAVRATLVPPLSMMLSLVLVVLTLVRFPFTLHNCFLRNTRNTTSSITAALSARNILLGALLLAILAVPLHMTPNTYSSTSSPVHYFLEKIDSHIHPAVSALVRWTLHVQPVIYPLGERVDQVLHPLDVITPYSETLNELDQNVIGYGSLPNE